MITAQFFAVVASPGTGEPFAVYIADVTDTDAAHRVVGHLNDLAAQDTDAVRRYAMHAAPFGFLAAPCSPLPASHA